MSAHVGPLRVIVAEESGGQEEQGKGKGKSKKSDGSSGQEAVLRLLFAWTCGSGMSGRKVMRKH